MNKRFELEYESIQEINEKDEIIDVLTDDEVVDLLNSLYEENKYLKKRLKVISDELYCKDRKLEELGVPIECCDKNEREKRFKEEQVRQENTIHELLEEKEYYREYALKYLTEYELFSDNFLNIIKDIIIDEEEFKKIKKEQDRVIKALKKEGLYD